MKWWLFIFWISSQLFASLDTELEKIWSQIEDICNPTLADYRLIDHYLAQGKRPYLDILRKSDHVELYRERLKAIFNFRLIGPKNESPIFEDHKFRDTTEPRAILLYSSSNGIYPKKARQLLEEIENSGYSGHVLLRIGGFPNISNGGLKICHVPYSFKVAFLQEARLFGFKKVLWLDLAIHPLGSFDTIFREIDEKGYFFTTVGKLSDNAISHLGIAAEALGIAPNLYDQIPHLSSSMIGLNLEDEKAVRLLETWYEETEKVIPCMTWWPEELSLAVSAWTAGCPPTMPFGNFCCGESEQFQLENRPNVEFYLDGRRSE